MPDYNPSVALGVNAPDPNQSLNTLSQVLSMGQKGLAIQGQKSENISKAAQATVAQQSATENQNLAKLMSDPVGNGLVDGDGNPTKDAQRIVMQAAPTTGSQHYSDLVNSATNKVKFNSALNDLRTSERQEVLQNYAGAAAGADSPDDIKAVGAQLLASKKGTPEEGNYRDIVNGLNEQMDLMVKHQNMSGKLIPPGQELWRGAVLNATRAGLPEGQTVGPGGLATPQAATQDLGGTVQPGVTAPPLQGGGFTGAAPAVSKNIPPGYMMAPNGTIVRADNSGLSVPGGGAAAAPAPGQPRTAAQDAPAVNAPKAVQDAYMKATQDANGHVEAVRSADENYGNNKAISSAVRRLASNTTTGPGTEMWNHAMGILGTPSANNYQELGAFLDRQAATVRGQMGLPGTNAGAEDAKMIAGNTAYNAKVIQDKNDYTEALTEGLHRYRNGLDRMAGFSGQASPQAVNQFKSAWTQNFDPNVYKGELAYGRSKAEGDAFVKSLAPEEAKTLAAKRAALQSLSRGQVPQ